MLSREIKSVLKNKRTYIVFTILTIITLYDLWININNNILLSIDTGGKIDWTTVKYPYYAAFLSSSSEGHVGTMLYSHLFPIYGYYSQQEMKGHGKNTMLESVF